MTDTAQPLPEPIDADAVQEGEVLRPAQLRRVEALKYAAAILAGRPTIFAGAKVSDSRDVWELLELADWILDGEKTEPQTPISQADADAVPAAPEPDSGPIETDGTAITAEAGWWKPIDDAKIPDPEPHQGISVEADDDTTALPSYPEDALPR